MPVGGQDKSCVDGSSISQLLYSIFVQFIQKEFRLQTRKYLVHALMNCVGERVGSRKDC